MKLYFLSLPIVWGGNYRSPAGEEGVICAVSGDSLSRRRKQTPARRIDAVTG